MMTPFRLAPSLFAAALAVAAGGVLAEKADRNKNWVIEADQPGSIDLQHNVIVLVGNAVVSQGSLELPDGYRVASAIGSVARPASWRQRREGGDEVVEGTAERIDFDGRADTLRLTGNGAARRLRGGAVADEITGATIVWDNAAEVFRVEGGASSATNPAGRMRAVLSPRAESPPPPAVQGPLAPSRSLQDKR
jgi:lipopolysaccharide export system protein LptA